MLIFSDIINANYCEQGVVTLSVLLDDGMADLAKAMAEKMQDILTNSPWTSLSRHGLLDAGEVSEACRREAQLQVMYA